VAEGCYLLPEVNADDVSVESKREAVDVPLLDDDYNLTKW
jgi:hypothetical protein